MGILILAILALLIFGIGGTLSILGHLIWLGILLFVILVVVEVLAGIFHSRR